jgi:hypothetical protein
MRVPDELKQMLGRLDCNAEYLIDLPDALASRAARRSDFAQREIVAAFLDDLLSNSPSYEDLQKVWWSGPIEILFKDEAYLRKFFKLLREELNRPPLMER